MKSFILAAVVALSLQVILAAEICQRSESGSKIYPGDCSKFYICDNGYANLLQCPNNLYFDGAACNYREAVTDCVGGTRAPPTGLEPAPTTAQPSPVDPEPVDPEPVDPAPVDPEPVDPAPVDPQPIDPVDPVPVPVDGKCPIDRAYYYLAIPSDCNKFQVCQNGVVKGDGNCSPGLVFKPSEQACVFPTGSSCPQ